MIPLTFFPLLVRTRTVWAGRLARSIPPSMTMDNRPLSMIPCTMKPHSSVWASSMSTGLLLEQTFPGNPLPVPCVSGAPEFLNHA